MNEARLIDTDPRLHGRQSPRPRNRALGALARLEAPLDLGLFEPGWCDGIHVVDVRCNLDSLRVWAVLGEIGNALLVRPYELAVSYH